MGDQKTKRGNSSMHASQAPLVRTPVLPTAPLAMIRRRPQWPFPVGDARRTSGDMAANAQAVIAISARAYLSDRSSRRVPL